MPRVPYPTGTVLVTLDTEGIPTYDIKENVAWDNIPFTDEVRAVAENTKAVCWGSLAQRNVVSRETIYKFLDSTPKDCMKIFDINLRQTFYTKEVICESMKRCNVLKINDEELVLIGRMFGYPGLDIENKCWLILGKLVLAQRADCYGVESELSGMECEVSRSTTKFLSLRKHIPECFAKTYYIFLFH